MNEDYFEKRYEITWESSVLNRRGNIPIKFNPIKKGKCQIAFAPWTQKGSDSKRQETVIRVNRVDTSASDLIKIHFRGQKPNSKAFVQSKTTILMKKGQEKEEIKVEALLLTADTYELDVEHVQGEDEESTFYKSPHLISLK